MAPHKILIVDDDPLARQIVHRALKTEGYDIIIAADALTALTQTRSEKPDLIILDIGLPAGGGFLFFERMKSLPTLALTPVVVISGMDPVPTEARAIAAGAVAYFEKPVRPDALVAKVRELLG